MSSVRKRQRRSTIESTSSSTSSLYINHGDCYCVCHCGSSSATPNEPNKALTHEETINAPTTPGKISIQPFLTQMPSLLPFYLT